MVVSFNLVSRFWLEMSYPVALLPFESRREILPRHFQFLTEKVEYYYWPQQLFRQIEARSPAIMKI